MKKLLKSVFSERIIDQASLFIFKNFAKYNFKKINENSKYYNKFSKNRCFILGNGPSLNQIDKNLLSKEIIFSVNQIARLNDFNKFNILFHVWADPYFFNLDFNKEEDYELFKTMKKVSELSEVTTFFPIDQIEFVLRYLPNIKSGFFLPKYSLRYNLNKKIRMDSIFPSYYNVVQYAISIAIYMGFTNIYLLGCETTSLLTSIKTRLEMDLTNTYSYSISNNENNRLKKISNMTSYESDLFNNLKVIQDYKYLNDYCTLNKINLYNCTPGGLIESIRRVNLNDVLK